MGASRTDPYSSPPLQLEKALSLLCPAYRWDGRRTFLLFRIVTDSCTDEKLISFLSELRKEFGQRKLILIWDGLASHRSRRMQQYLSSQKRLTAVRLPPYSPDLNPGEFAWGNIQTKELANLCSNNLGAMVSGVRKGFARVYKNKSLPHPSTNMQVYPSIMKDSLVFRPPSLEQLCSAAVVSRALSLL
jgi:hypothetical protein